MNNIEKIKELKRITDFGLTDCKNAYEECGKDFDKALSLLNSRKTVEIMEEMTDAEKREFEKYKVESEKRSNRKAATSSRQKRTSIVYTIFSALLFIVFIGSLITEFVSERSYLISVIVISGIMSIVLFVTSRVVAKMSDKDFAEANATIPKEIFVSDNDIIRCPHCGSEHMTYQKKGFSEAKALIGMSLIGIWGVMFGVPGKHKIKATCLKCGYSFMIKKK